MVIERKKLDPIGFKGISFNIIDNEKFNKGLNLIKESLSSQARDTLFFSDNIITWNRNYSFFREEFFRNIVSSKYFDQVEKSIIWRTYILLYFSGLAKKINGDYIECGTYKGTTANSIIGKIDFYDLGKKLFLYDLFEWKDGDDHEFLDGHKNLNLYDQVKKRFESFPFVEIIKGRVPDSFSTALPDKIAFAHIDMNSAEPEAAAVREILPRLSDGGIVVLDDYGWWDYSDQKIAIDPIVAIHGLSVMELPTGQGVIIKYT